MIGLMVGCFIGGPIGDKLGRKKSLVLSMCVKAPLVAIGGFVKSYEAYLLLRFLTYISSSVMWINSHTIILELFGTELRKLGFIGNTMMYYLAYTVMPMIAYVERDWKFMHLWCSILVALVILPMLFGLNESVRWMILNKRKTEALKLIQKYAKANEEEMEEISQIVNRMEHDAMIEEEATNSNVLDLFKGQFLKQTLIMCVIWIIAVLSYYAVAFNATKLAGDLFLNFVLTGLADFPSSIFTFLAVDKFGRRHSLAFGLTLLGLASTCMAFIPRKLSTTILIVFLIGKFSSAVALDVVWLFTAELYPTNLRAQAMGTMTLISRIFGTGAPYVEYIGKFWQPLPFLILGLPAFLAALLSFKLPETVGKSLIETAIHDISDQNETELEIIKERHNK